MIDTKGDVALAEKLQTGQKVMLDQLRRVIVGQERLLPSLKIEGVQIVVIQKNEVEGLFHGEKIHVWMEQ